MSGRGQRDILFEPVPDEAAIRADERRRLVELGWESPEDVALLHAIKDQFARQARAAERESAEVRVRLDDHKAFTEGLMAAADSLRATVAALREQVADALALCTEIRPDSVIGTSVEVRLGLVRERLAMPNPKSAPTGGDSDGR